jgi:replication factor C subunit 2/4
MATDKVDTSSSIVQHQTKSDVPELRYHEVVPWVDKYRPNKLEYVVHQTELMLTLKNAIISGSLPHLLFYGPPGTGKTTTVLALANELFGPVKYNERILELNASDDRGISVVRNEIITFSRMIVGNADPKYPCPPYKILILDEADAMTSDAQSALRKVMEETSSITRFCIICNYVDKIIEPIASRCMKFKFQAINNETMIKRLKHIAKKEKMFLNDCIFDTIVKLVDGDLRRGIMLLQNVKYIYNIGKKITETDICDLDGHVPEYSVEKLLNRIISVENKYIVSIAKEFYSQGYPVRGICEQLALVIIHDRKISDAKKIRCTKIIAKTCENLGDGSSELLQLVNIAMQLNNILHA